MTESATAARLEVARPAPATDRSTLIDALRALALFGVVVMNLVAMVMLFKGGVVLEKATPVDLTAGLFDLVFLQGKARSAFAFLFGLGFGMMMQRIEARDAAFVPFYLRRVSILLLIGLLNLAFLFWGDILIVYALLGMALILFRGAGQKTLLTLGLLLVLVPPVLAGALEAAVGPLPNLAGLSPEAIDAGYTALAPAYLGDDFLAYIRANFAYYLFHNRAETSYAVMYDLGVLGLFLLGLWAARKGVLQDIEAFRPWLRRILWSALPLGLVFSLVHATRRLGVPADGALYGVVAAAYVGLPVMAFGYMAAFSLYMNRSGGWLARALAPMGRMALTGYLGSNLIGSFVWYGWGLGQIGDPAFLTGLNANLFAVAVFAGLCLFSALWLGVFRFGPAEWVWRSLTYGRLQPLLRR